MKDSNMNENALRAAALLALGIAIVGCSKKDESTRGATSAAPAPVAPPTKLDAKYAGAVGDEAKATMHLVRDGERVTGEYAYTKVGRSIALVGMAAADGTLALQESVGGKITGRFSGKLASDGVFSGTWTSADGQKELPFRFEPSTDAVVPPVASTTPTARGKTIEPASKDAAAGALVKIAKAKGTTVDRASAAKDFDDLTASEGAKDGSARRAAFGKKYGIDLTTGFVSLHVGDVNNDGADDYVFTQRNSVGLHNDDVAAVFLGHGAEVTKSALPPIPQLEKMATNFSIAEDSEGTVMYFTEAGRAHGNAHRILWKGTAARPL